MSVTIDLCRTDATVNNDDVREEEIEQRCGLCDAIVDDVDIHMKSVHAIPTAKLAFVKRAVASATLRSAPEIEAREQLDGYENWLLGKGSRRCELCLGQFRNGELARHVTKDHKVGLPEYRLRFPKSRVETVYMTCRICDGKVVHDVERISRHLAAKHSKMSLREYFDKHVPKANSRKRLDETAPDQRSLEESANGKRQRLVTQDSLIDAQTASVTEPSTQPAPSHSPVLAPSISGVSSVLHEIWNACLFSCPYCGAVIKSASEVYVHIRTKHDGLPNSLPLVMEHALVLRYYECHLCHELVVADLKPIGYHVRKMHYNMPMATFRMRERHNQVDG